MIEPRLLRQQLDIVNQQLLRRGFKLDLSTLEGLEQQRKTLQTRMQELQQQRNDISKQVGIAKAKGQDASALLAQVADMGKVTKQGEVELEQLQHQLNDI